MVVPRAGLILGASMITIGCSGGSEVDRGASAEASTTTIATTVATAIMADPTTIEPATTSPPTSTDPTTEIGDPDCVVTVVAGDSLSKIAEADSVTVSAIQEENRLTEAHVIHPGDELDVCIGNEIDDVTGASRLPPGPVAVRRQQQHLNELFAPYRIAELEVDGDSGPLTRQLLCAARTGLGLRASTTHMSEGSPEENALFAADSLSIPDGAAVWANRWILIDKTCQLIFTGEGDDRIVNVYPTSTGEPGFETRDVQSVAAFRFDPALDNGGWHDSTNFPVEIDNPLNGNMYKPIYFNGGQAIHGANYVPPEPHSKGCARLFPWHQDELIAWLGLGDVIEPTWRKDTISVTVTARGDFRPAD